jgi:aspartyl-tRNA(Asn)/glutamyl-tRNA(Gln) amidotransferase subunit A
MIPLGTGSDGGGSIRIPSSVCGLPGLKPSAGRIPLGDPEPPGTLVLSTRGPMTTRLDDLVAVLDLVVGPHPADPFSLPPPHTPWTGALDGVERPARVLWAPDGGGAPIDSGVRRVTAAAIEQLADAGTEIIEISDLFTTDPMIPWFVLWSQAMARTYQHVEGTPDWERVSASLRDQIEMGRSFGPLDVIRAFDELHRINHHLTDLFHQAPLLLLPTVNGCAPLSGEDGTVDGEPTMLWACLTQAFNLSRNPAGSVPVGLDDHAMPVGLQVVGPQHADVAVLRAMAAVEQVVGFDARPPEVG